MTPSTGGASTNQRSSGAKRPRISPGSRDGTKSSTTPNLRSLNGNEKENLGIFQDSRDYSDVVWRL